MSLETVALLWFAAILWNCSAITVSLMAPFTVRVWAHYLKDKINPGVLSAAAWVFTAFVFINTFVSEAAMIGMSLALIIIYQYGS